MVPIGRNALVKQMNSIASIASPDSKFTNSSGRETVSAHGDDFDPLGISELTGHANPESISKPREKQRRMSNKLAGFNPSTTTEYKQLFKSSFTGAAIVLDSTAPPSNSSYWLQRQE